MLEPSYKSSQYLHDYACKLVEFLHKNKIKYRLKDKLLEFIFEISYHSNTKIKHKMNYPIDFININENINCFLYECSKYKFPNQITKIIHQLQQYHQRHQKK